MANVEPGKKMSGNSSSNNGSDGLHAHFQEEADDLTAHDSLIAVEQIGDDRIQVRLGFLQIRHVYEIRFSIVDSLEEDLLFDPLENLNVKINSVQPSEDGKGHDIVLTFRALKEKLIQETISLKSSTDESKKIVLILHARVLGKGKGTPALKKGIHCVRIEWDEDSDGSDWQGF